MKKQPDVVSRKSKALAMALLPAIFLSPFIYKTWSESVERNMLQAQGVPLTGTVVRHNLGKGACRSNVEVEYTAAGTQHIARGVSRSCSFHQENVLVGNTVSVRYVPNAPATTEIVDSSLEIESNRLNWFSLVLLNFALLVIWWAAYKTWIGELQLRR